MQELSVRTAAAGESSASGTPQPVSSCLPYRSVSFPWRPTSSTLSSFLLSHRTYFYIYSELNDRLSDTLWMVHQKSEINISSLACFCWNWRLEHTLARGYVVIEWYALEGFSIGMVSTYHHLPQAKNKRFLKFKRKMSLMRDNESAGRMVDESKTETLGRDRIL